MALLAVSDRDLSGKGRPPGHFMGQEAESPRGKVTGSKTVSLTPPVPLSDPPAASVPQCPRQ